MRIATFNINNINKRLGNLLDWLEAAKPDVVCLQELKAEDALFLSQRSQAAGYSAVWRGQRSWNGVAILARGATPIVTRRSLPGDPADRPGALHRGRRERHPDCIDLPAERQSATRTQIRLQTGLVRTLCPHAAGLMAAGVPAVLAGDYNVVPTEADIWPAITSRRTRSCNPRAAQPINACWTRDGLTPCASSSPKGRCGRFGATCVTAGPTTRACASIISCSVVRFRAASSPGASTASCAGAWARAITPPSGSSCILQAGSNSAGVPLFGVSPQDNEHEQTGFPGFAFLATRASAAALEIRLLARSANGPQPFSPAPSGPSGHRFGSETCRSQRTGGHCV